MEKKVVAAMGAARTGSKVTIGSALVDDVIVRCVDGVDVRTVLTRC